MTTNFPGNLDSFTNPTGGDLTSAEVGGRTHSDFHADVNDAIEALEAKVGADSSGVTTSHDYKLSGVTGSDKAASKEGTELLKNKKLEDSTTTIVNSSDNTKAIKFQVSGVTTGNTRTITPLDVDGTMVLQDSTQTITNKTLTRPKIGTSIDDTNGNEVIKTPATASAVNEVTVTNAAAGNDVSVTATGDDTDIGIKIKGKGAGKVKLGTAELQFPNSDGADGQVIKTNGSGALSFVDQTAPNSSFSVTAGQAFTGATTPEPAYISGNSTHTLMNYSQSGGNQDIAGSSGEIQVSYKFSVASGYKMLFNRVVIGKLSKVGSPTANLNVYIYSDSGGNPGSVLYTSTTTLAGSSVTGSSVDYNFDFSTIELAPGTYHVVIQASALHGTPSSNHFALDGNSSGSVNNKGDGVGNWLSIANRQLSLGFQLVPTAGTVYKTYAGTNVGTYNATNIATTSGMRIFDGYVTSTVSAGGAANFYFSGFVAFTGLTSGSDYYVQNNGTLGTSAGDNSVICGRAYGTTRMFIQ